MKAPSVSVIMPLYNKGAYVTEAIRSVLAQGHPDFELLVIDDGSTDDGPQRVVALREARVKLIQQTNAGVSAARNRGIELAAGDLVAFLDADDCWQPGYLDKILDLHRQFPAACMFCTGYAKVDAAGHRAVVALAGMPVGSSGLVADFYRNWCRGSFTCSSSIVVRRTELVALAPAFPPGEKLGEDQDLWFRLAERAPLAYCNRPLADYRVGVAGSATQSQPVLAVLPCFHRLAARLQQGAVPPTLRQGARRLLSSHYLNVARAQAQAGMLTAAWQQWRQPWSSGNALYWLRTALWLMWCGVRPHKSTSGTTP